VKNIYLFLLTLCAASVVAQSELDENILNHMDNKHVSGIAAVIFTDSGIVWEGYYGLANREDSIPVTDSTIFMLASISKTITATALMQLHEEGLFELDDPVNEYLPFEVIHPVYPDSLITFRHLLTHTASIEDNWGVLESLYTIGDSPISLLDFFSEYFSPGGAYYNATNNFYSYKPGTQYNYSNVGAALCGLLVETMTGTPFNVYCNEEIFAPLCMDNTGWFLSELNEDLIARPYSFFLGSYDDEGLYGYPDYPDGQLRTTARSLAKFAYTYMSGGVFDGNTILQAATIDSMLQAQYPDIDDEQGLMWYSWTIDGQTLWGHNGGDAGVSTDMYIDLEQHRGYIILTNGNAWNTPVLELLMASTSADWLPEALPISCQIPTSNALTPAVLSLSISPNPTTNYAWLQIPEEGPSMYRILDLQGRCVRKWTPMSPDGMISFSSLLNGRYQIQWANGRSFGTTSILLFR
jgi:CubicO group peptidase (beta-lactamase class C family)